MFPLTRRTFFSLTAATAVATALTAQSAHAATGETVLNGQGKNSGALRQIHLNDITYSSPFAQAFTHNDEKTFAGATRTVTSDALVQATFTHAAPVSGGIYNRLIVRRTANGRDYYTAVAHVASSGEVQLLVERVVNLRPRVLSSKTLNIRLSQETALPYEFALSIRDTRLIAQLQVPGHPAETLEVLDNRVPITATPHGTGTGISVYAGKTVPNDHLITVSNATADNWGQHRGSTVAEGWGNLIFEDDFTEDTIDSTKWRVRDKDYVGYDSGVILKESVTPGPSSTKLWLKKLDTPVTFRDGKLRPWATGYLDTIGKFSAEYFRLEYRAKQPASYPHEIGAWGGIWMRPDKTALLGEIDISESYGFHSGKQKLDISNRSEGSVHYGQQQGNTAKVNKLIPIVGQQLSDEYHTWAVEKTPAGVRFFFDGIEYLFASSDDPRYQSALPVGEKFNIRLSMQAGNAYWGGLADTTDACAIEVDYVRVWEYLG